MIMQKRCVWNKTYLLGPTSYKQNVPIIFLIYVLFLRTSQKLVMIGNFQMDQCYVMLKVSPQNSTQDDIWSQKRRSLEQNISIGSDCVE